MDEETDKSASRKDRMHKSPSKRKKKHHHSSSERGTRSSPKKKSPPKEGKQPTSEPTLARTPSQRSLFRKAPSDTLTPSSSGDISSTDTPIVSVKKTLAQLQSIPTNRSCAECRSPLLDPSQTFASFTPSLGQIPSTPHLASAVGEFKFNHEAFAPPGGRVRSEPVDPALKATQQLGGFGVFVCAACGAAHKSLGDTIAIVHSVLDTSAWTPHQVDFLSKAGGNARAWTVYERYMPQSWDKRRPNNTSTHAQRQVFVRAKYDALAFLTPPGGPLAQQAWLRIVKRNPDLERWASNDLKNIRRITLAESQSSRRLLSNATDGPLPSRLVDFFCVVGHSGRLAPEEVEQNLAERNSPGELCFEVKVSDCYPPLDSYSDMEFPEHISTFLYPDGCRPSEIQTTPTFFTFVLTLGNGQRLYGAAMHVYDDQMDTDHIRKVMEDSGYTVPLPWWLHENPCPPRQGMKLPSEVVYIPKCLVVLSHYPFFDIWRKFLTQIYRISMVEAPLPIERYIANFVSEVPLPPLGKVEVKFGFTSGDLWSISRPAVNKLPLANFSYRPLFACLSTGNIMVVSACLMQEVRVALLSRHYALLGPVAEALLSLLFPFEWQGMYIPIMPFAMLDILDAPVPFIVGLHSRYLSEVPRQRRPTNVVFVDLDKDCVHLGFDDEGSSGIGANMKPRFIPDLPERDAGKLKAKLDEFGGMAYLVGSGGAKGRILTGQGEHLHNSTRPLYAQTTPAEPAGSSAPRTQTLSKAEKAFPDDQQLNPIEGFVSEQGHTSGLAPRDDEKPRSSKMRNPFKRRTVSELSNGDSARESTTSLLELSEPDCFSAIEIRNAFLRFFVALFNHYERYVVKGSGRGLFQSDDFLESLSLPSGSHHFVSKLLATQMFQRFLQERKINRTSPSVLFFDESITAKNNRSRKTTLTTGGKQKTPFLDDPSGEVTEVYTPAPPSNWGLPDDGRNYQYGSFPSLNAELFGKVRPPKQWPQKDAGTYRTVATAAALKQQELIAKAMGPRSSVPTLVTQKEGRPSARDMEWALGVLSRDANDDGKSRLKNEHKVESRASAQQQILAARRKQGILIDIVTLLQAYCRMFIARRAYLKQRKALVNVQRRSRRTSPQKEQDAFRDTIASVSVIQTAVRSHLAHQWYKNMQRSAISVQRVTRGTQARREYKRLTAAMLIQRWIRGSLVRCYMARLRQGAIKVQAILRGRRTRFGWYLLKMNISQAQARVRGYLTRKVVSELLTKRISRFKQQIFALWKRAHTPLAYRTKMWPVLNATNFLSLTLAEGELQRLWSELDVGFPPSPKRSSFIKDDRHCALAYHIGISNHCYLRWTKVQAMLEMESQGNAENDASWFRAVGSPHWKKAAERETLERLQVYERLQADTDKASLQSIYNYFDITRGDKKKKSTLVDRLWENAAYASRSVAVMVALFPELEYGTYMNYVSPTKKGQRRFHVGNRVPLPLDSSMQVDAIKNQLIKTNMKEFAVAYAERVPTLMMRLDEHERSKTMRLSRQRQAEMYARRIMDWPRCRHEIILDFLYPGRMWKNPF